MKCRCEPTGAGDTVLVAGLLIVIGAAAASAVTAFLAVAATVLLIAGYLAALVCVVLAAAALVWRRIEHDCLPEPASGGLVEVEAGQVPAELGSGAAGVLEAGSVSSLADVIEVREVRR